MDAAEHEALNAYIEARAELNGDRRLGPDHLRRIAAALPPLLALAARIGPWPEQPPAGALDALDSPDRR